MNRAWLLVSFLTATVGENPRHPPLVQLDPIRRGHVRTLNLASDRVHKMETLNIYPPVFGIEDFLEDWECDHIIQLAKDSGLNPSATESDIDLPSNNQEDDMEFDAAATWDEWNSNGDEYLDSEEIIESMSDISDAAMTPDDVASMFEELDLDWNKDAMLDFEEFAASDASAVDRFVKRFRRKKPWLKRRYSAHTWLQQSMVSDPVLRSLRKRVEKTTQLPKIIIERSEPLQVVHYTARGHNHGHHDSHPVSAAPDCCHRHVTSHCRLCRYMTLLYYLNDVSGGGETAFPAVNRTYDEVEFSHNGLWNLSAHCDTGLVVKPRKGFALVWYNHQIHENGEIGELIGESFHGGCDVLSGEKWIANNWIAIDHTWGYDEAINQHQDIGRRHSTHVDL